MNDVPHHGDRRRLLTVCAVGIGQIFAWGTTYYLLSIMAAPIGRDTGWSSSWIIAGLSLGMLVSGLVSPAVGRLIERIGGRPVLAASAILIAAGLVILALAPSLPIYVIAWLVIGLGMGCGLYDPVFAALGRLYGKSARGAITLVALFGGIASTICWPLNAFFIDHLGWRGAAFAFAAIHIAVVLPLYWFGFPREARREVVPRRDDRPPQLPHRRPELRAAYLVLAAGFTFAAVVMTVVAILIVPLLQARGFSLAAAVGLGALIGPAQVGSRVIEAAFGRTLHPLWTLLASAILIAVGLFLMLGPTGAIGVGLVLYGAGSGLRYIARGTVPLALFGPDGYATLMGRIAMPVLVAQAASPFIGNTLLNRFGPNLLTIALAVGAVLNIGLVLPLLGHARRRSAPA